MPPNLPLTADENPQSRHDDKAMKDAGEINPIKRRYVVLPAALCLLILLGLYRLVWQEQRTLVVSSTEYRFAEVQRDSDTVAAQISAGLRRAEQSVERYRGSLEQSWQNTGESERGLMAQRLQSSVTRAVDRAWRSRPENYDAVREFGVWLPAFVEPQAEDWQLLAVASEVTQNYGLGAKDAFFVDTWFMPHFGGITIYWPDEPAFIYQAEPEFDYRPMEWVTLTLPEQNPERKTRFTSLSFDPVARQWMISAVAPIYAQDRWLGSVGHDMPLAHLLDGMQILKRWEGSRFVLLNKEHMVLASDRFADRITSSDGHLNVTALNDGSLVAAVASTNKHKEAQWSLTTATDIVFVNTLPQQDWLLIYAVPTEPLLAPVSSMFTRVQLYSISAFMLIILVISIGFWLNHRRILHSVEAQRQAQKAMEQALLQSDRQERELAAISYGISHDLRAPLRHMNGYTQMLREQMLTRMTSEDLRLMHTIEQSNRRASRLVEKLLIYLRVTQHEMSLKEMQLQTVVERAIVEVLAVWPAARVDWHLDANVTVMADANLLREMFHQLFDNAISALENCNNPRVSVSARVADEDIRISVSDNGHGFDNAKSDRLFEVFQKLDAAGEQGPGVGLAIVRRVAERHSGRVWAESQPTVGTTIWIVLPRNMNTV